MTEYERGINDTNKNVCDLPLHQIQGAISLYQMWLADAENDDERQYFQGRIDAYQQEIRDRGLIASRTKERSQRAFA